jgi:signal transduction histidine kinase
MRAAKTVPGACFEEIVRSGAELGHYADAVGRVDAWVAERMAAHLSADSTLVQRHINGRTLRIVERKMPDGHIVGFRIDITELVQATEAAQAASAAKSHFLANMSHEIRTPMNAILGMLKLLRRTDLDARQADYAVKTEGAARSLLGLLNDILNFSKIEAGKVALDLQAFSMDDLLRDLSVIVQGNLGTSQWTCGSTSTRHCRATS